MACATPEAAANATAIGNLIIIMEAPTTAKGLTNSLRYGGTQPCPPAPAPRRASRRTSTRRGFGFAQWLRRRKHGKCRRRIALRAVVAAVPAAQDQAARRSHRHAQVLSALHAAERPDAG